MKLLYCHDNMYFHSEFGGVYSQGQFPYSYFAPFLEAFDELVVVGRGQPLDKNFDLKKLNLSSGPRVDFQLMPNMNSFRGLLANRHAIDQKLKALVQESDAVIIRAVSDLGWLVFNHARGMNKPIAMEMAACAWDSTWNHGSRYAKIYAPIRYYHDRVITRHADYALYVSQNFLQSRYMAKGHTAVASNVRIPVADPQNLEKRLQKIKSRDESDLTVIGLIGTLGHKLKGIHTALEAMKRMEKRESNRFIFRILGPGNPEPYRQYARKLGLEHLVFFDGTIQSGSEVLKWLEEIDLYIQPSFQEGVPRATIEAMSVACPVIGSTAGGIPELLPPDWLHKPGDCRALERLMERFMASPQQQLEAAVRNFEKSKFYTDERLKPVRRAFWSSFADFARSRQKLPKEPLPLKHAV